MEKRHYPAVLLVAVLAAVSTLYLNSLIALFPAPAAAQVVADLSASRYFDHVKYLSSDAMKGRGDGSPELDKAADYIAAQFKASGLRPMGDNNTYFQKFELTTGAQPGPHNELQVGDRPLKINEDFVPIVFSNTARFDGPLVFVGYGITA